MATEYKPTREEKRFLRVYRQREPNHGWDDYLLAAALPPDWLKRKITDKPEFIDWFMDQIDDAHDLALVEIKDRMRDQILSDENKGKTNPRMVQAYRDLVKPEKKGPDVVVQVGQQDPDEVRRMLCTYLFTMAAGQACPECGGPRVNWEMLRQGIALIE